jgi:hypothetical protein
MGSHTCPKVSTRSDLWPALTILSRLLDRYVSLTHLVETTVNLKDEVCHRFCNIQATRLECFVVPHLNFGISFSLHYPRQHRRVIGVEALANESVRSMLKARECVETWTRGRSYATLWHMSSYMARRSRDAVATKSMARYGKSRVHHCGLERIDSTSINRSETGLATHSVLKLQQVRKAWHEFVKHPMSPNIHPKDM